MKTRNLIILAVASLFIASCSKKENFSEEKLITIIATFDDSETKTSLDGNIPKWNPGDQIMVMNGTSSQTLTLSETEEASQTTGRIEADHRSFSFQVPESGWNNIYAVYPASCAKGTITGGKININIPAIQDGTFANANISVAYSNSTNLEFKNATAVLNIAPKSASTINNDNVFFAVEQPIVGDFSVSFSDGKISSVVPTTGGTTYNILKGYISSQTASYYAVAPVTSTESLTLTVRKSNELKYATLVYNSHLLINTIYNFRPEFTASAYSGGEFSISSSSKIEFSAGNLYYDQNTTPAEFKFEPDQYDFRHVSGCTSPVKGVAFIKGIYYDEVPSNTVGTFRYGSIDEAITTVTTTPTGDFFAKENMSVASSSKWRTLNPTELKYLNNRVTKDSVFQSKLSCLSLPNGEKINGAIYIPDNCQDSLESSVLWDKWLSLEIQGAVFLPSSGERVGTVVKYAGSFGNYWTSKTYGSSQAMVLEIKDTSSTVSVFNHQKYLGNCIRLVKDL